MLAFDPPRLADYRYDILAMVQVLAPHVIKSAFCTRRFKGLGKPFEVSYHVHFETILAAWINSQKVNDDLVWSELTISTNPRGRFNITIDNNMNSNLDYGKKIVLELSAHVPDKGDNSIESHLKKCHEVYAQPAEVCAVYYINFTSQSEDKCFVPDRDHPIPLIHVRHDEDGKVLGLLVKVPGEEGLKKVPVEMPQGEDLAVREKPEPHGITFPDLKEFMIKSIE
jgi:hypothetical protein